MGNVFLHGIFIWWNNSSKVRVPTGSREEHITVSSQLSLSF